jgi:serine/threonine protein kinase/tetratricopeptide (TPR) repeat protein
LAIKCPKCQAENPETKHFCGDCGTQLFHSTEVPLTSTAIFPLAPKVLAKGATFASKYKIIEELGRGGMAVIYKAEDIKLKRAVALKFLSHELTDDPEARGRFILEARAASALDHPNVCTIFEIEETQDGQMYIAMPCYEGETLKTSIQRGPLQSEDAVEIAIQTAQGLAKAHSQDIVHRDIKPANIMVTNDGVVKILDFGLAKLTGQTRITQTATVMGTIVYMSPEQARADPVDQQTDCWSLGIVLYEMLTGQLPFTGEREQAVINSILNKHPIPPSELKGDIPKELDRIILKCLRKQKSDRYPTARLLARDLVELKRSLEKIKAGESYEKKEKSIEKRETERRQATLMFAEILGYAEMLQGVDPDEASAILNRYLKIFSSIEEKYDGTIERITDNTLLALFGVPKAIEDGPKKAVNAAIELRRALQEFQKKEKLKNPLDIRAGINTGLVIAGAIAGKGKRDITVMGDAVNWAGHLKDISEKGKIYVGHLTFRYTREAFEYKPVRATTLKDRKEPVFELLSEKEKIFREQLPTDRMIDSEMVGRDRELDRLRLHVLKVINGEGSLVNVIGEAGIGKSRLIAELCRKEEIQRVTLLKGRAVSIGRNLSFHPIIDILKEWSGIREEDSISLAFRKLEENVQSILLEDSAEIFPFIAILMGMKLMGTYADRVKGIEGEALEKLIMKNLRELFARASERKPLVVIVEDLHWADLTSITFLESLYRLAGTHPILFINVFRPDYEDTGGRIVKTTRSRYADFYSEIVLESLDENHAETLIDNLLKTKGLAPRIRELIISRTGGNPFFIEEIARSFIDDGVVEIKDGRFQITAKIDSVIIPETIQEVLMARIDKLDEDSKSLLKISSVIGRFFFYRILARVAVSVKEVDVRLECLKESQLILERRRMDEVEYLFKHALAQEATYESILPKKRKELHIRIAKSIESVFSERLYEFYGMLAYHYSKGEDLEKAEEYLIKAGEEALKSSASNEALHYYTEALNTYLKNYGSAAEPLRIAMFEKNIAIALFNKGQYLEADGYFAKALSSYGERQPKHRVSVLWKFAIGILSFLASIYIPFLRGKRGKKALSSRDSEIVNLYLKKNTALVFIDPRRMFIEVFYWIKTLIRSDFTKTENGVGIIAISSAAFSYAGISFRLSKKILEFTKDKINKDDVRAVLYFKAAEAIYDTWSGHWSDLDEYDDLLVKQNLRIGELFYASVYIMAHGNLQIARGDLQSALTFAERLREIADFYGNDYVWVSYYWYRTQVLLKFRKMHEALLVSDEASRLTDKTGFQPYFFAVLAFRARVLTSLGDMDEAEKLLHYLNKIKMDINIVPQFLSTFYISQVIFDLRKLAEAMMLGDRPQVGRFQEKIFKTTRKMIRNSRKIAADITESYNLMGISYWLVGRQTKALRAWQKSIKEGARLGAKLELSRVYYEVGRRLAERTSRVKTLNGITGLDYLNRAREMFQAMDLKWDIDELEKERARLE